MSCRKLDKWDFHCKDHPGVRCIDVATDQCKPDLSVEKPEKKLEA